MPNKKFDWRELFIACLVALLGWISLRSIDHGEALKTLQAKLDSLYTLVEKHCDAKEPAHASATSTNSR